MPEVTDEAFDIEQTFEPQEEIRINMSNRCKGSMNSSREVERLTTVSSEQK